MANSADSPSNPNERPPLDKFVERMWKTHEAMERLETKALNRNAPEGPAQQQGNQQ